MDAPILPVSAYWASDPNTADIYLTDLQPSELDRGTDLSNIAGRIVHIHMFITPSAGSTPIGAQSCSMTVRHIVLANGAIGVYAGGGFFLPKENPGAPSLNGTVSGATLRLTGQTPTFADRLGPAVMEGRIDAPRDPALAKRIGARVDDVLAVVKKPSAEKPGP
jgi:hypothetical protein